MITRKRLIELVKGASQMGSSITLVQPAGQATLVSKRLISLEGDEGDSGPWVVTMSGPVQPLGTGVAGLALTGGIGTGPDLFARVFWGSGGVMHTADIDWVHGGTFVVCGHTVTVDVLYPFGLGAANILGTCLASLAPGSGRSLGWPPQRTIRFNENGLEQPGSIAALGSATVIIPAFARRMRHTLVASATIARTVTMSTPAPTVIAQWTYQNATGRVVPQWPADSLDIPRNASNVTMTNNDAALAMTNVAAIFDLDL